MKKQVLMEDGCAWKPSCLERPFVLTDGKGGAIMLYLAIGDGEHRLSGNIAVPLKTTSSR